MTRTANKLTLRLLTRNVSRLLDAPVLSREVLSHDDMRWERPEAIETGSDERDPPAGNADEAGILGQWEPRPFLSTNTIRRLGIREEFRFILMAKAGDRFAQHKLIVHHLPLLKLIARRFQGRGLMLEELVSEGTFGLARAIERFDVSRKVRFGTYAKWWIRDAMEQSLLNQGRLIRLPRHVVQLHKKQQHAEPHAAEEQQVADMQPEESESDLHASYPLAQEESLTEVVESTKENPSHDGVDETTPELLMDEKQHRLQLLQALAMLSERERKVIEHRFGLHDMEPRTLEALAEEIGVSCERVRQIQKSALGRLKQLMAP